MRRAALYADALAAFAGRYESAEIASRHSIRIRDGALIVEYGPGADRGLRFAMEPIAPDVFLVRADGARASRTATCSGSSADDDGAVVGAVVTLERLKGVRLRRVPG